MITLNYNGITTFGYDFAIPNRLHDADTWAKKNEAASEAHSPSQGADPAEESGAASAA